MSSSKKKQKHTQQKKAKCLNIKKNKEKNTK